MKRFLSFYGSKWRIAYKYPDPIYPLVIEPFAGGAGYSTHRNIEQVWLNDADPIIAGVWDYLMTAKPDEIKALPVDISHVEEAPPAARSLIGWWFNSGVDVPCRIRSAWARNAGKGSGHFWSAKVRDRIAEQLSLIRHWRITNHSYHGLLNIEATWFIDPPYNNKAGSHYRCHDIDYEHLADWCLSRKGQIIVCENEGANWLPFETLGTVQGTKGKNRKGVSKEVIFTREKQWDQHWSSVRPSTKRNTDPRGKASKRQ